MSEYETITVRQGSWQALHARVCVLLVEGWQIVGDETYVTIDHLGAANRSMSFYTQKMKRLRTQGLL